MYSFFFLTMTFIKIWNRVIKPKVIYFNIYVVSARIIALFYCAKKQIKHPLCIKLRNKSLVFPNYLFKQLY